MSLSAGTHLGPYEILSPLGAGGMGDVWKARDTRLNRSVAVKVCRQEFSKRFENEARAIAALNHPNICTLHDIGPNYLVMEYIEGPTLGDRIHEGAVPVGEALHIAQQIAAALEAAHEKGIVHRDLKPANIKLTNDGKVKVLDFGLAKATGTGVSEGETRTQVTEAGAVVGTVAYMSPEQARGQQVDKRSDIWSFGCVLYETLSGEMLFAGKTRSDILAAILRDEPKLRLPEETPPRVRLLIERCLRREVSRRLRDIGDARLEIEECLAGGPSFVTPLARVPTSRGPLWMAGGVLLATAILGGWWLATRPHQMRASNIQFQRITDMVGMEESPAISPDGKTVAFVARVSGRRQIWIRLLTGGAPLPITHDEADHEQPRWAPDSSSLIYYSAAASPGGQGAIWEIPALGGAPRRIASALGGGDISHDGQRIAAFQLQGPRTELITFGRDGSGVQHVKLLEQSPYDHPRWSPDDRSIAFRRGTLDIFEQAIYIVPAAGGEPRKVARSEGLRGLAWLADNSGLVYASSVGSTILYPRIYNLRTIRRDGSGDRQLTFGEVSYVEPDVHQSGKVLASRMRIQSDIWKFPIVGSPADNTRAGTRITEQTGQAQTPSLSPDAKELVYLSDSGGHGNLWVAKTDGPGIRQITFERDPAVVLGVPVWSPANQIAFIRAGAGHTSEWLVNPDGSGIRQFIPDATCAYWSGDGRWFYYDPATQDVPRIEKVPAGGGPPVRVRSDAACPAGISDDATLFYVSQRKGPNGGWDYEIRRARPEDGPSKLLGRVAAASMPGDPIFFGPVLSPDGKSVGMPLLDGATTNLFALPADGGAMRRLTDFGSRSVLITRRISWSPDSKYIYAAVADIDSDVVLLDGLLR